MLDLSDPKTAPQDGDSVFSEMKTSAGIDYEAIASGARRITAEVVRQRFEDTEEIHISKSPNKRPFVYTGHAPVYTRYIERSNAPYIPWHSVKY